MQRTNTSTSEVSREFGYCPVLADVLTDGRLVGANGKQFSNLGALSTRNNLRLLRQLVLEKEPKETLEIGLAFGGSALALLATLKEVNGNEPFRHTAIDPFQSGLWDSVGIGLIEKAGFSRAFEHIADYSSYALPALAKMGRRFGLIYVDGSHIFEDVFIDAYYSCEMLSDGGVLVFDDCSDPHVVKVIRFLRSNYMGVLQELPIGGLHKAIARRLDRCQARVFMKIGPSRRPWDAKFRSF